MFERKTKEINLFGRKFLLSERNASDAISLTDFSNKNPDNNITILVYKATSIIEASLRFNYLYLHWYEFFKKIKLKRLLSQKSLIENLSQQQIFSLAQEVLKLEGFDVGNGEKKT